MKGTTTHLRVDPPVAHLLVDTPVTHVRVDSPAIHLVADGTSTYLFIAGALTALAVGATLGVTRVRRWRVSRRLTRLDGLTAATREPGAGVDRVPPGPPTAHTPASIATRLLRTASDGVGLWVCPLAAGCLALLLAGPVAAGIAAAYTTGGLRAARRHRQARADSQRREATLDRLSGAAAALRAGQPATTLAATGDTGLRTAVRLAERTGAPVVDLVERIEADLRATARMRAAAGAQSAGARATALLLAGLPAGGIALGYGMGVDPAAVLLRTPLGAACAAGALILQLTGLAWSRRIVDTAAAVR